MSKAGYGGLEDFMKAKKQERIIVGVASALIAGAAVVLFVSGLGDNVSGTANEEVSAMETYADAEGITTESYEGILGLSSINADVVGSPFTALKETETSETEVTTETVTETVTEVETEPETEPYKYANTFLVNVDEYLNVRSTPSTDGEIVGKIYRGSGGEVVEKGAEWSKVVTGNVQGYVCNQYVWFAEEAEAHMSEVCIRYGVSNADSLRVRKGPSTSDEIIAVINSGAEVQILSVEGDWAKVNYIGKEAYISAEYLEMEYVIGAGITIEEELEAIRLEQERLAEEQRAAEEAEAARQAKIKEAVKNSQFTQTVQTSAYNVSEEDAYLLACLVCSEAGYESYEGKLAVANIVLNRLNGGYYGNTIYDVVYARGQFSVVNNGALNRVINNGPNAESLQAAKDALAGKNNVPNYSGFCSVGSANFDAYAEYSIICNQVFYRRK